IFSTTDTDKLFQKPRSMFFTRKFPDVKRFAAIDGFRFTKISAEFSDKPFQRRNMTRPNAYQRVVLNVARTGTARDRQISVSINQTSYVCKSSFFQASFLRIFCTEITSPQSVFSYAPDLIAIHSSTISCSIDAGSYTKASSTSISAVTRSFIRTSKLHNTGIP